jgi:hypothetical protein
MDGGPVWGIGRLARTRTLGSGRFGLGAVGLGIEQEVDYFTQIRRKIEGSFIDAWHTF